ncbi:MAG: hypothetical protein IKX22_01475 [Prevotella sp.]|nr:hypothetical protein [Prevotella sp.]
MIIRLPEPAILMDMKNKNEVNDIKGKIYVKLPSRIKKHAGSGVMSGFFHSFVQSVLNCKNPMILRCSLLSVPMLTYTSPALGQDAPGSSIVSRTRLSSDGTKLLEQRVYDNGLGDVVQEVQSFPGSSLPDLVVHHEYDDYRRRVKTWLPITSSGGGFVSGGPGTPRWNGSISAVRWRSDEYYPKRGYKFTYDKFIESYR